MNLLKGISASPGIAIGKAFLYHQADLWIEERHIRPEDVEAEVDRFRSAVDDVVEEIQRTQDHIYDEVGEEIAKIFEAHLMMLHDQVIIEETIRKIREERLKAECAFFRTLRRTVASLRSAEDAYLRERAEDVEDIQRRVILKLIGREHLVSLADLETDSIVVARNLSPSDTVHMHREHVLGFVTDVGGSTSHAAIVARALEIPAVVGVATGTRDIGPDDLVVLDGSRGVVYVHPDEGTISEYQHRKQRWAEFEEELAALRDLPAVTLDGHAVEVAANIEFPDEVESALVHGARGIGLYRTEFIYLAGEGLPSEAEQVEAYRKVVERIMPDPVVIRTLDLGGDKIDKVLHTTPELNPFLGWRAIRVCLEREDIFLVQLRAILRAGVFGAVKIMFPMISGIEELRRAKEIVEKAKDQLRAEGIPFCEHCPVGAMIEVPSAAMTADHLAEEVDFFSIGTNDLVQYTVAVDRGNERIAYLFDHLHIGVLRLIQRTIEAGHRAGIPVGLCGEMSRDPLAALLLLGMGLDSFSMAPMGVPEIKMIIREVRFEDAQHLTEEAMTLHTKDEIRALLIGALRERFGDLSLYSP